MLKYTRERQGTELWSGICGRYCESKFESRKYHKEERVNGVRFFKRLKEKARSAFISDC